MMALKKQLRGYCFVTSKWRVFLPASPTMSSCIFLILFFIQSDAQIRYSIPEEMRKGSLIGNVAQDLGLDLKRLRSGRARIVTGENVQYAELKTDKGTLVVNERIDREQLCGDVTPCTTVTENSPKGTHVLTVNASDIDSAANSQVTYSFSQTKAPIGGYFDINHISGNIVVAKELDFEKDKKFEFRG
uniref:Cadherin domain-containing protein n=1 Tax=Neogobius melanostomus TaxID=47308 RepID=A0A8C6SNW6_9GOBI